MSVVLRKSGNGRPRTVLAVGLAATGITQDIVTATLTPLVFTQAANEVFASVPGMMAVANQILIPRDGFYQLTVSGLWEAGTGGAHVLETRLTIPPAAQAAFGPVITIGPDDTNAEQYAENAVFSRFLTAASILEIRVTQGTGGNIEYVWNALLEEM